jgi:hypothetical protein
MKIPGTNAGLPRMTLRGSGSNSRLGPRFADRPSRIARPGHSGVSNVQNSNRECQRLETTVTRRKERIRIRSNRENEAFFCPVGEGVHLPPGLGLGVGCDLGGMRGASETPTAAPGRW